MENLTDFESIISRYSQSIYRFSHKLLNDSDDAYDVTQETFISAWKNLKKFDKSRSLKTWLFSIAKNKSIDVLRKKRLISFSSLNDADGDTDSFESNIKDEEMLADEIFEKNENIELVERALQSISPNSRAVVLLHDGEEMTFEEISEVLNKPMNTVKSQYRRTLIELKKFIESARSAPKP